MDGLVNDLPFDNDHLMLVNGTQQVTGIKTFSNHSELHINKLKVAGLFNDVNITDFYNRQVRVLFYHFKQAKILSFLYKYVLQ